jgi:Tol biopolymer transport system component/DNA-binding winged helix-turn-helix (wHTH) protein
LAQAPGLAWRRCRHRGAVAATCDAPVAPVVVRVDAQAFANVPFPDPRTTDPEMLDQHRNLSVPQSGFLRIGECVLDLPRREVDGPCRAQPMRITPKAQQVLMVLVAHHGRVVSREALIEWVWPDTLPTDDVLTQAIAQLRKAFCDDRDAPRYLETIAKGGYRLLADIEWLRDPADAFDAGTATPGTGAAMPYPAPMASQADLAARVASPAPMPTTAGAPAPVATPAGIASSSGRGAVRRLRPATAGIAAVALLFAGVFAWRGQRPAPEPDAPQAARQARAGAPAERIEDAAVPLDFQRITSSPGGEGWPSLSPDGGQVVYSAGAGAGSVRLMVQATAPVPPRELTPAVDGRIDMMAVWSPDGRQIAFVRDEGKAGCSVLLIPSSGGSPRTVGKCHVDLMPALGWHPDSAHIIAAGVGATRAAAMGFQVLDLATGQWTPLPYEKTDTDVDMSPAYSPDGRWIAFQRNISLSDLWRMPATGGRPERLTRLRVNIHGLAWTPDAKAIVFGGYRDLLVKLMRLDLDTRRIEELGSVEGHASAPSTSTAAQSLAFVLSDPQSRMYSLPIASAGSAASKPEPVFPSSGQDLLPSVSPDGRQIAFVSDRSQRDALWWAELGRPESLRLLEGLVPMARYAPVWSADSRRLLMAGRAPGEEGQAIFEIEPASARVSRLPVPADNPIRAEYLPDPARLLVVADAGGGRLALTLYDRSTRPWRALATLDDVVFAKPDPVRGRVLFTRPAREGLWQVGLDLAGPRLVAPHPGGGAPNSRRLVLDAGGAWLATSEPDCGLRRVALEPTVRPGPCLHAGELSADSVSYDAAHERLYFSTQESDNSDIGWMRLARR